MAGQLDEGYINTGEVVSTEALKREVWMTKLDEELEGFKGQYELKKPILFP